MRRPLAFALLTPVLCLTAAAPAWADSPTPAATDHTTVAVDDLSKVPGLTDAQKAAIAAYVNQNKREDVKGSRSQPSAQVVPLATYSTRASFYRGSALMWTRDNVDFGYDYSKVVWTSPYQECGWIFPNMAWNLGYTKYYDTTQNDRFRFKNRIGAGVATPWGDVTLYTQDFTHRISVWHDGYWTAWADN